MPNLTTKAKTRPGIDYSEGKYLRVIDIRDLFDFVRAAYFEGGNTDDADEVELRAQAYHYAGKVLDKFCTQAVAETSEGASLANTLRGIADEHSIELTDEARRALDRAAVLLKNQGAAEAHGDERAAFEAWCVSQGIDTSYWLSEPSAGYAGGRTCDYWTGWQARAQANVQPKHTAPGWADAYAAFQGAFDTPLARRRMDDEVSQDARRRLREFNEAVLAAQAPAPAHQATESDDDTARLAERYGAKVAWANEPDEFHHLIEMTPPQLRALLRTQAPAVAPALTSSAVAGVDYERLVTDAWALHKYRCGTPTCIAFKRGAEWQAAASKPPVQHKEQK